MLIGSSDVSGSVTIAIYWLSHQKDSFSFPRATRGNMAMLCGCEIGPHAIRIGSVVVVAIAITIDIREVRRTIKSCPILYLF